MAEPTDATAYLSAIDGREVQTEDPALPGAESHQSGEETQEARLARAVRADEHRKGRRLQFKVHATQQWKIAGHRDGTAKQDR